MVALRQYKKSQTVFYQGEVPSHSFRVKKGLVRAYIIHENGDEATVAFFGPGDIFPVATSFHIAPVTLFYYETVVDSVFECYRGNELVEALEKDATNELHRFAKRYAGALLHISSLAQNTAHEKVVHTLLYLAIRFGEKLPDGQHYKILLRLTQQDIAKLCNMSRETASIELGILKETSIVTEHEKYYVVHMGKLSTLTGEENPGEIEL